MSMMPTSASMGLGGGAPYGTNGGYPAGSAAQLPPAMSAASVPYPSSTGGGGGFRLPAGGTGGGEEEVDPEFEEMVSDLRRTFVGWLKKTELELKQQKSDQRRGRAAFEEEKLAVWQQFMSEKQREVDKIREDRRRYEEETAARLRQVQVDMEDHRRRLGEEHSRHEQDAAHRKRGVAQEYEKFRQEYGLFEAERQRLVNPQIAAETRIDLNVGGTVFETSRATLVQQPGSYLEALLSGRYQVSRDRNGRIFINRDPEHFRTILNFLRNPQTPPMPRDACESESLIREAQFYGIHFFPFPLVFAVGGHDGFEYLRAMEVLDVGNQCWRPCRAMQIERTYFGAATLRNKLHVFGGSNLDKKARDELEVYDCLRDTWETGASMMHARRNCASAELDGRIYAIGGFDGSKIINSVEAYDHRLKNWMMIEPLPTPRSSAMACAQRGKLYVLGGTSGTRLKTVDVFDPRVNRWESFKAEMNMPRSAGQAASCVNHLFAFGGTDNEQNIHFSMETLDNEHGTFHSRASMKESRMDFASAVISDSIMVGGGQNGNVLSSTEFYRPELNEWQSGPSMMVPRYGHQYMLCTL